MEINNLRAITEGLLFASGDEGITIRQLSRILDITEQTVEHLLEELKYDYENTDRGIMIMQSHQLFHLTTKPEHSPYFKKLVETSQTTRMSQAALETLAIVAYRQPITRTEIEEIRGVKSDRPVQKLIARSLIEEFGRRESVGRPVLFGTSKDFLTYFGLTSLEELPALPENPDEAEVEQEADLFYENFSKQLDHSNNN